MANSKFQNALRGEPQATPPIWFMRQAGRYHQHYQGLRSKHSFVELCKSPKLAAEVALGPIDEFDFDVSILFSDILFSLEALGMDLAYNPGPQFAWQVTSENVKSLRSADEAIESLAFQKQAMIETRKLLPESKSLIGFIGAPWTLFTYAVEGSHNGHMLVSKTSLDLLQPLYEKLLPLLEKNIEMQFEGGAEVVMLFDTSAGNLSPALFQQAVFPAVERLSKRFPGQLGYYAKGIGTAQVSRLRALPLAGMGYDHRFELSDVLASENQFFVQGNFDQAQLFGTEQQFMRAFEAYLEPLKKLSPEQRKYWVCGLGHGVLPQTPEAHVKLFVDMIRQEIN